MRIGLQYSGLVTFLSVIREETKIELEVFRHKGQVYICLLGEFEKLADGYEKIARVKEFIHSFDGTNPTIKVMFDEKEGFVDPDLLGLEQEAPQEILSMPTRLENLKDGDDFKFPGVDSPEWVVLEAQETGNIVCAVLGPIGSVAGKRIHHFNKATMVVITVTG